MTLAPSAIPAYRPLPSRLPLGGYASQVSFNPHVGPEYTFWPNPKNAPFRFAVMGDAGTGDAAQYQVARQLSVWHRIAPFNTVMVLGDNVYPNGEPSLFQDRIARPYQDLFQRGVQFRPVRGNHDVKQGYGDWQSAYWGVPPFYNFKLGPPGYDIEFWGLDTNMLLPGTNPQDFANPFLAQQKAASQLAWLERTLASSTASMKVVYAHHPLYSTGAKTKPKRNMEQMILSQQLAPLFTKYGVDLYMAGHEHHYEKPVLINGTYHLVSGAGGKLDTPKRGGPEGNGLLKRLHFMLFEITPQGLTYRTISERGEFLDCGKIPRKHLSAPSLYLNA
ncbi:MAG: metallophosphoesterase [Vampirovibrio sp.]|jgi:acid phosphatase|nr:metallophosphoesterase [Vampirovibrio sp.]